LSRGSVSVFINYIKKPVEGNIKKINESVLKTYMNMLSSCSEKYGIKGDISWETLLKFSDIFEISSVDEEETKRELEALKSGFSAAIAKLIEHRAEEGAEVKKDLSGRVDDLENSVMSIKDISSDAAKIQFERLLERLNKYADSSSFDKERMEQELVILSDKVDISEEISRLEAHIKLFREALELDKPAGQKLNFIAQELHREANTTYSKTNLTDVSQISVAMKESIEKIREQVQNVE